MADYTYKDVTITDCIERAKWSATAAYWGKRPTDGARGGEMLDEQTRARLLRASRAWSALALVMQNEREYEERKIHEIREQHTGGHDGQHDDDA